MAMRTRSMRSITLALALGILLGALVGCSTTPLASVDEDFAAKQFDVPSGKSVIYVYRDSVFWDLTVPVWLNDRFVGDTVPKSYYRLNVNPGVHKLACQFPDAVMGSTLTLNVE